MHEACLYIEYLCSYGSNHWQGIGFSLFARSGQGCQWQTLWWEDCRYVSHIVFMHCTYIVIHSGNGRLQDFRLYLCKQDCCQFTHHIAWTWISWVTWLNTTWSYIGTKLLLKILIVTQTIHVSQQSPILNSTHSLIPSFLVLNFTHRIDELSFGKYYPNAINPLDNSIEVSDSRKFTKISMTRPF